MGAYKRMLIEQMEAEGPDEYPLMDRRQMTDEQERQALEEDPAYAEWLDRELA